MSLQDNFNATYNKKQQQKAEREKLKTHDDYIQTMLLQNLELLQIDYITERDKDFLLLPKTKNNLIEKTIKNSNLVIRKKSKYIKPENQKIFLLKKYNAVTSQTLRLARIFDKKREVEDQEKIRKQLESEKITSINKTEKPKNRINWGNIGTIIFYILIIPFALLWGMLEGLSKGNKKKRR